MVNDILFAASVFTALGVIVGVAIKIYKFVRKCEKWIEKKDKHDEEQYCDILRLIIMTPEMPLSERIAAGDIYVNKLHRNGGVKKKYEELLNRFSEEHKE